MAFRYSYWGKREPGKTYLAELLSKYCVNEKIAQEGNIYHYGLSKNENGTTAISRVFGYRDGSKKVFTGLLEKSDNGVLIIEKFSACG